MIVYFLFYFLKLWDLSSYLRSIFSKIFRNSSSPRVKLQLWLRFLPNTTLRRLSKFRNLWEYLEASSKDYFLLIFYNDISFIIKTELI